MHDYLTHIALVNDVKPIKSPQATTMLWRRHVLGVFLSDIEVLAEFDQLERTVQTIHRNHVIHIATGS